MLRREGLQKLTGKELYIDDQPAPGVLWGMTVRSAVARGTIREIRFGESVDWSRFVVVDHRDVPNNQIRLIELDQPVLASGEIRHMHEAIVLIAGEDREEVRRAVNAVEVVVDELPAVLDYRVAPTAEQIQFGDDNVLCRHAITKGDVEAALASADHVVEGIYETGAQEHVYIEPQGMLAWEEDGVICVKGSMQCPYYVLNSMTHAFGREDAEVRVVQAPTGGGFGGKEDYPSNIAVHTALLAIKAKRPVKIIYDRGEDMAATTKRHPSWVRHRTGLMADGTLVAQDIEVVLDAGAYITLSPVVLSRGIIHAAGPYSCPNVRILGRGMLSNSVPYGAFRGFGTPQTEFALERHMDRIAGELGIDEIDLRKHNMIRDGQTTATGQTINDGTDRMAVLDRALDWSGYQAKRESHTSFNAGHPYLRRGMGVAWFWHGAGFTGAGEVYLKSIAHVAGRTDGGIEVRVANTEMGQGANTIFTQVVSDRLGLKHDDVHIAVPDTAVVPNSGPTVASRTTMVVGKLVEHACDDLRTKIGLSADATGNRFKDAMRAYCKGHDVPIGSAEYEKPPGINWDEDTYTGDAYGTFAWAAYAAEVEVDLRTWNTTVLGFWAVQEIGKVLNETLARGQIQGGVVQAIGWALMEDCLFKDGGMWNNGLTNYIIPTSGDTPTINVEFVENPYAHGAQGAKGIGELPMDGPAPAILNAVARATGSDPCAIPLMAEYLMKEMTADVV